MLPTIDRIIDCALIMCAVYSLTTAYAVVFYAI